MRERDLLQTKVNELQAQLDESQLEIGTVRDERDKVKYSNQQIVHGFNMEKKLLEEKADFHENNYKNAFKG